MTTNEWQYTTLENLPMGGPVEVRFNRDLIRKCYGVLVGRDGRGAWQNVERGSLYDYQDTEWRLINEN